MAATLLGSVVHDFANASATVSDDHTLAAGSDRIVVVLITGGDGAARTVSSVTYGGQACVAEIYTQSGVFSGIYYILETNLPGDGVNTATITMSAACSDLGILVLAIQDAFQAAPEDSDVNTATGTSSTITLTVSSNSFQVDILSKGGDTETVTPGANQTERWDEDIGGRRAFASTAPDEATMSCTFANRLFMHHAASFAQAMNFIPRIGGII